MLFFSWVFHNFRNECLFWAAWACIALACALAAISADVCSPVAFKKAIELYIASRARPRAANI